MLHVPVRRFNLSERLVPEAAAPFTRVEMKVIAMWRGSWATFRTGMVSLLMLATLLVYAIPSHAILVPHDRFMAPHEHAAAVTADETTATRDHDRAPCGDEGVFEGGVCCSVAQCATMHGGLITDAVAVSVPRLTMSDDLPAPIMPEGIGSSPAQRPPRLII